MCHNYLLLSLLLCCLVSSSFVDAYSYETKYFTSKVDHFSFSNPRYFQMRYLINASFWRPGGPIFFYAGNEGNIVLFCNNTGFMWDIAPQFSAMLVFAEHRFYGTSMPFGSDSYTKRDNYGYLTSEQALADYVDLLAYLKSSTEGAEKSPVIAFGGSYGGMLAAWMRIKYPNVLAGVSGVQNLQLSVEAKGEQASLPGCRLPSFECSAASGVNVQVDLLKLDMECECSIASSAPIWQFTNMITCDAFSRVTTNAYELSGGIECVDLVKQMWGALNQLSNTTEGRDFMVKQFKLCSPLTAQNATFVKDFLNEYIIDAAMGNYPYPAEFLGTWPAWPVREFCRAFINETLDGQRLSTPAPSPYLVVQGAAKAILALTNYTGGLKCLNVSEGSQSEIGVAGWDIQTCNEMVMPFCSNGKTDMFEPVEWSLDAFVTSCKDRYNLTADPGWIEKEYWGKRLSAASNILFSNGLLDPWSSGGVMKSISSSLPAIIIPSGAHHLDLRGRHPQDPVDVIQARAVEATWIRRWISEWNRANKL